MMLWLIFISTAALSLWAAARVKGNYARYSRMRTESGLTGADVAQRILHSAGIDDVEILASDTFLGDHYDPIHKRLVLSQQNFLGDSPAALGIAAHECGHAIQHKAAYAPLRWRMASVGLVNFAHPLATYLPFIGVAMFGFSVKAVLPIVAAAWGVIMLFNLITLPVEFDASRRAKLILQKAGYVNQQEAVAVNKVLDAAALTYVAAFVTSLAYMLYYLLPLLLGRRSD